jgi:hypothetical protein
VMSAPQADSALRSLWILFGDHPQIHCGYCRDYSGVGLALLGNVISVLRFIVGESRHPPTTPQAAASRVNECNRLITTTDVATKKWPINPPLSWP